eukprot:gene198-425_t
MPPKRASPKLQMVKKAMTAEEELEWLQSEKQRVLENLKKLQQKSGTDKVTIKKEPKPEVDAWGRVLADVKHMQSMFAKRKVQRIKILGTLARQSVAGWREKESRTHKGERDEAVIRAKAKFMADQIRVFWTQIEQVHYMRQQHKMDQAQAIEASKNLDKLVERTELFSKNFTVELEKVRSEDEEGEFESSFDSADWSDETEEESEEDGETPMETESEMPFTTDVEMVSASPSPSAKSSSAPSVFQGGSSSSTQPLKIVNGKNFDLDKLVKKGVASGGSKSKAKSGGFDLDSLIKKSTGSNEDGSKKKKSGGFDLNSLIGKATANDKDDKKRKLEDVEKNSAASSPKKRKNTEGKDKLEEATNQMKDVVTGNTLATTNVTTKVPAILHGTLREYQVVGLHWMATLHDRKFSGILADEMGLGKTIQTIALIAWLVVTRQCWGPHLIVVPSSVVLNWETEFKRWCPGLKILTYYGSVTQRAAKRRGWNKEDSFHVCITSYSLVIQDASSFRRKKWYYLILDEAQHIKNFKSMRWQTLLTFNTERRLLLTGTPLQNDLMELWSLMHFLMPDVFESHADFKDWFANPLSSAIEKNQVGAEKGLVDRLHAVLRPFMLRRLKKDVEKQMPMKYEHVMRAPLSKRQRALYNEFIERRQTQSTVGTNDYLGMMNIMMQLRKVCNHPDLFEERPTESPFFMGTCIDISYPSQIVIRPLEFKKPESYTICQGTDFIKLEEKIDAALAADDVNESAKDKQPTNTKHVPTFGRDELPIALQILTCLTHFSLNGGFKRERQFDKAKFVEKWKISDAEVLEQRGVYSKQFMQLMQRAKGGSRPINKKYLSMQFVVQKWQETQRRQEQAFAKRCQQFSYVDFLYDWAAPSWFAEVSTVTRFGQGADDKCRRAFDFDYYRITKPLNYSVSEWPFYMQPNYKNMDWSRSNIKQTKAMESGKSMAVFRAKRNPYGTRSQAKANGKHPLPVEREVTPITNRKIKIMHKPRTFSNFLSYCSEDNLLRLPLLRGLVYFSPVRRMEKELPILDDYAGYVYPASANPPLCRLGPADSVRRDAPKIMRDAAAPFYTLMARRFCHFPSKGLLQYDCGKFVVLAKLLHKLRAEGHKCLIFTQMAKMLDVLEQFININRFTYVRLDGSTKVEDRQRIVQRFNQSEKLFLFISSTRSGGVGLNLTGADTVIFYDSDWNPAMDRQAMDRAHRIGQKRDVHVYRLLSEHSVEENIWRKQLQKRRLDDMVVDQGKFTIGGLKEAQVMSATDIKAMLHTTDCHRNGPRGWPAKARGGDPHAHILRKKEWYKDVNGSVIEGVNSWFSSYKHPFKHMSRYGGLLMIHELLGPSEEERETLAADEVAGSSPACARRTAGSTSAIFSSLPVAAGRTLRSRSAGSPASRIHGPERNTLSKRDRFFQVGGTPGCSEKSEGRVHTKRTTNRQACCETNTTSSGSTQWELSGNRSLREGTGTVMDTISGFDLASRPVVFDYDKKERPSGLKDLRNSDKRLASENERLEGEDAGAKKVTFRKTFLPHSCGDSEMHARAACMPWPMVYRKRPSDPGEHQRKLQSLGMDKSEDIYTSTVLHQHEEEQPEAVVKDSQFENALKQVEDEDDQKAASNAVLEEKRVHQQEDREFQDDNDSALMNSSVEEQYKTLPAIVKRGVRFREEEIRQMELEAENDAENEDREEEEDDDDEVEEEKEGEGIVDVSQKVKVLVIDESPPVKAKTPVSSVKKVPVTRDQSGQDKEKRGEKRAIGTPVGNGGRPKAKAKSTPAQHRPRTRGSFAKKK